MFVAMLHQQRTIPIDQQYTRRAVVSHHGTEHNLTLLRLPRR